MRYDLSEIREIIQSIYDQYNEYDPFILAEKMNIKLVETDLLEAQGFYFPDPNYEKKSKSILLNENLSHYRKLLVFAHELGHAILHPEKDIAGLRQYTNAKTSHYEIEADFFAYELIFAQLQDEIYLQEIIEDYELTGDEVWALENYYNESSKLYVEKNRIEDEDWYEGDW